MSDIIKISNHNIQATFIASALSFVLAEILMNVIPLFNEFITNGTISQPKHLLIFPIMLGTFLTNYLLVFSIVKFRGNMAVNIIYFSAIIFVLITIHPVNFQITFKILYLFIGISSFESLFSFKNVSIWRFIIFIFFLLFCHILSRTNLRSKLQIPSLSLGIMASTSIVIVFSLRLLNSLFLNYGFPLSTTPSLAVTSIFRELFCISLILFFIKITSSKIPFMKNNLFLSTLYLIGVSLAYIKSNFVILILLNIEKPLFLTQHPKTANILLLSSATIVTGIGLLLMFIASRKLISTNDVPTTV